MACDTTLVCLKCTSHLFLQNIPQFEYFSHFLRTKFRLHFWQAYQKIPFCSIFGDVHFDQLVKEISARFLHCEVTTFLFVIMNNNLWRNAFIFVWKCPVLSSVLVLTFFDFLPNELFLWLLNGDFLIPCFRIHLLAFCCEDEGSLLPCLICQSVNQLSIWSHWFLLCCVMIVFLFLCILHKLSHIWPVEAS